jgi:hypothetical protein
MLGRRLNHEVLTNPLRFTPQSCTAWYLECAARRCLGNPVLAITEWLGELHRHRTIATDALIRREQRRTHGEKAGKDRGEESLHRFTCIIHCRV